jgi:hypothetical protein
MVKEVGLILIVRGAELESKYGTDWNMNSEEQLERVSNRFEIAVANFGRSCIDLQSNEKAFQAWFASCVIQEFGISHVYREIHLGKAELFRLAPENDLKNRIKAGNELFPDLSISWSPNIDTRHSSTRENNLRKAGAFLREFCILSELKVTGSTSKPTPPRDIKIDIAKLFLFSAGHLYSPENQNPEHKLKCYMVILDNAKYIGGMFRNSYTKRKISSIVEPINLNWDIRVTKPDIILLSPGNKSFRVYILRRLTSWDDLE